MFLDKKELDLIRDPYICRECGNLHLKDARSHKEYYRKEKQYLINLINFNAYDLLNALMRIEDEALLANPDSLNTIVDIAREAIKNHEELKENDDV